MQACSLKPSVQLFSSKASGLQRGTAVAAVQRLAAPAARSTQLVVEGKRGMLAPQWPTPAGRWPRAWVLGGALCEWKLLAGRPRGWSGWSRQLGRRRRSPSPACFRRSPPACAPAAAALGSWCQLVGMPCSASNQVANTFPHCCPLTAVCAPLARCLPQPAACAT